MPYALKIATQETAFNCPAPVGPVAERTAFFLTLGYPSWDLFYQTLDTLEKHGVGYVEIGIPVSNPTMEGEVIKRTHELIFPKLTHEIIAAALSAIRRRYSFRVILMTYAEGIDYFQLQTLPRWSYDAMLCVDSMLDAAQYPGLVHVFSEQMSEQQISSQLSNSSLFAYVVTQAGKTGGVGTVPTAYRETMRHIRHISCIPIFVGFGIKSCQDIKQIISDGADGVIIGSELIRQLDAGGIEAVQAYIRSLGLSSISKQLA